MGPIGIFDSGFGGLTVFKEIEKVLPQYDYVYLGDNARVPYGTKSFEVVYRYTWECVSALLEQGCPLVIIACNTASAKALRAIQQHDLPLHYPDRRVLGVIRPTSEQIGKYSKSGKVGVLGTNGTVESQSFPTEIERFHPQLETFQQACPMWVPLIEDGDLSSPAMRYYAYRYVNQLLVQHAAIDTIILGCTHYPLIAPLITEFLPDHIQLLPQGELVAQSLAEYLDRHPEIEEKCLKNGARSFLTTDDPEDFAAKSALFFGSPLVAEHFSVGL